MATDPTHGSLGKYDLVTRLAAGGMAEIFLARERGLADFERIVVVKRILPHLADDPEFVAMFQSEARIIAQLSHPNVVRIFELGEEDGTYFIAMEYIHGCTLRELQVVAHQKGIAIPPDVAIGLIAAAANGAHAAHELTDREGNPLGLVHRDISPQNVMITAEGHVKLIDFGIAQEGDEHAYDAGTDVRGKYGYMSPEQCENKALDRRSDVFSLGTMLWELAAGRPLFKRSSELKMMKAITESDAPPVQFVNPSTPEQIDAICMHALEREVQRRYPGADAMRHDLKRAGRELQLDITADRVGAFVRRVVGERIAERDLIVDKARRAPLTIREQRSLVQLTDISALQIDDDDWAFSGPEPVAEEPGPQATVVRKGAPWALVIVLVLLVIGGAAAWWTVNQEAAKHQTSSSESAQAPQPDAAPAEAISPPLSGEPVVIGWAPTMDSETLRKDIEPLRLYLQQVLRRPVTFEVALTYGDLGEQVAKGDLPYGVFPALLYLRTSEQTKGALSLMAVKQFEGATTSDGYLLVRRDSAYHNVEELEGKRICYTDENSTTGYFLPRSYLEKQGFDPNSFVGQVRWSGDHLQGMRDLLAGECEATATYSDALLTASSFGVPSGKLRVLAVTGHMPQDVFAAGPGAQLEERAALEAALLAFEPTDTLGQPYLGDSQRITGFDPANESLFDSLRAVVGGTSHGE